MPCSLTLCATSTAITLQIGSLGHQKTTALAQPSRAARRTCGSLRPKGANTIALRIHNPAKGANSLTLSVNGKALAPIKLEEGWQNVRTQAIEPGILGLENVMELNFSNMGRYDKKLSGGMIAWAEVGVIPRAGLCSRHPRLLSP